MNRLILLIALAACGGAPSPAAPAAAPVAHRYPVGPSVGQLVIDDAAFAELARAMRRDVEADLRRALPDAQAKDRRFVLALLDALDGRWPDAVDQIERVRALETEPRAKAMTGLTIRVWADALGHGGDTAAAFHDALERALAALPVELVKDDLSVLRTMGQVFSPEVCRKLVDDAVGPHVERGTISFDDAQGVAFQRYAVKRLVQVGSVIDAVLGAHGIAAKTE